MCHFDRNLETWELLLGQITSISNFKLAFGFGIWIWIRFAMVAMDLGRGAWSEVGASNSVKLPEPLRDFQRFQIAIWTGFEVAMYHFEI